jgi:CRP/FNR family transcriptional regulator
MFFQLREDGSAMKQIMPAGPQYSLIAQNSRTDAADIHPKTGALAYAPGVSEDILTGGRALRAAFHEASSDTAQRGDIVIAAGDPTPPVLYIQRGMAFSFYTLPDGRRGIGDIFLPTDFIGIEHVVAGRAFADIAAAGMLRYRSLSASTVRGHFATNPHLALRVLALSAEQKVRQDRHRLALTRLDARERIADFFIGIYDRLRLAGLIARATFNLPLTQDQVADHLGITMVHVSRTLKRLRQERLVLADRQVVIITDVEGLRRAASALPDGTGRGSTSCRSVAADPARD